ncbi:aminotransferase class I/II-fold pyridoxal phosphate-dependent enzyme [Halobacillus salinus]|uniref:Aminotransferase class I/II-fold pyridoxal phosphate-dependent enzyme n=1 Tax=Halobacillus salinus TaxID=192814 RepID=A0A4Z0GVA5_9BACI|nr:aminotransferase class I/II-fold pyridoxal phosphate-dependent enzyme [Halobacillus salinus]TGB00839.1 aminotransferase class I/II-fold pyridoxal phosphate-dependent enzyme [Halobacillus salinus]
MDQNRKPIYEALIEHQEKDPISFHVPGHKSGRVFPETDVFKGILKIDATEIAGLDDLHAPEGIIKEAEQLTSDYFGSNESFFLINGSTVGNLAMVLSTCERGDRLIVQRNCHKSVLNGLELAGAEPVFIAPEWEEETGRYSSITREVIEEALQLYPSAKGVLLTYPDYFGRAYRLDEIADVVHRYGLPLLIDEAHGVHFQLGAPFPKPALESGADVVVQSAHKMAPAMTMASFLHRGTERVDLRKLKHYLQMLQSSSPSYPLMASLDLARYFLATMTVKEKEDALHFIQDIRTVLETYDHWRLLPVTDKDDPLKATLEVEGNGFEIAEVLEEVHLYPELATSSQVLLTFGLGTAFDLNELKQRLELLDWRLKNKSKHATIKVDQPRLPVVQSLEMSFSSMQETPVEWVHWSEAAGRIAAEAILPYPPGIAVVLKGERMTESQICYIEALIGQGARFQNEAIETGIRVFKGE